MSITEIGLRAAQEALELPQDEMPASPEQYYTKLQYLLGRLSEFLCKQDHDIPISESDKLATYTASADYLQWVTSYHHASDFAAFIVELANLISPFDKIIDVGCASGISGLSLIQYGRPNLTFYDYEGMGLRFLRWMIEQEGYSQARTVPYGNPIEKHTWAIALDVLEHTGNHLAFLKWLAGLGENIGLCYPVSVPFYPPYISSPIDEWVDDEAIQWTIARRHTVLQTRVIDGRRYTIYKV